MYRQMDGRTDRRTDELIWGGLGNLWFLQAKYAFVESKTLTAYEILQCLYVDDGAFPFGSREDLKQGMELVFPHFGRFGLEMHIGRGASPSKTECVFFPPPNSSNACNAVTPPPA